MRRLLMTMFVVALVAASFTGPTRPPVAEAATNWPIKIFSVGTPSNRIGEVLANRYVAGVSNRYAWSAIEPSPGTYRWGPIDDLVRQARAAGKLAQIRVIAGIYSPDWVLRRVPTLTFSNQYLYNPSRYPSTVEMPIPWKNEYQDLWARFVRALGRRYNGNATIYSVHMSGGGFIGEMTLPNDIQKWKNNGYTDPVYAGAWKQIIGVYRDAFPSTPISLGIVEPWGDAGMSDVVDPVVAFATKDGVKKAHIQSNALRPDMLGWIGPYRGTVRDASRVTKVGYQMIGDAPTVSWLRDACTVAVQDNVNYVEVYASDVLTDVNQTTLRYLATDGNP